LNVRDYLLLQLHKEISVHKGELARACEFFNPAELASIFSKLCTIDRTDESRPVWLLKNTDPLFYDQFPWVKERFDKFWLDEERRLNIVYRANSSEFDRIYFWYFHR
jgi:hypothetical protein